MRLLILSFTILTFILANTPALAHKDRIEKTRTYRFTFLDGQTVAFDNTDKSALTTYNNEVVNGKRKLIMVKLTFRTGEVLTFEGNGIKWTKIQIADGKNQICIHTLTIEKISSDTFANYCFIMGRTRREGI